MAGPSFIRRTLNSLSGGAKLGASLGVTAGIMSIFLFPGLFAGYGLGAVLIPLLIGYAAGMAIGGLFFSGVQITSDVAHAVTRPFFPAHHHPARAQEHVIDESQVAKIVARERKQARAEAIAEMAEANEGRRSNHREQVTAGRGGTVNINRRA